MSAREGVDEQASIDEHVGVEDVGVDEHTASGQDDARGDDAPWWRSRADRMDAAEDPVALHLAARNGVAVGDAATDADAADVGDPPADADAADVGDPAAESDAAEAGAPVGARAGFGAGGGVGGAPIGVGAAPGDAHAGDGDARDRREPHDDEHLSAPGGDAPTGAQAHPSDCEVCPICRGLAHVRATHPELAEHLVAAARHLTLAMREVVDTIGAAADSPAGQSTPGESSDRPERSGHPERSAHPERPVRGDRARAARPARTGRARPGASPAARGFESIPLDDVGGAADTHEMEDEE
ncbi:MAG TPA: hypothetical protein VJ978_01445 [Nitriliruptoraceae bacterium]|nr:hypothetical protein [Nitriliruptoraceae bacterium]